MAKQGSHVSPQGGATHAVLTRRERQIVDILYRRGRATAGEVMDELSGDPSYSTVRILPDTPIVLVNTQSSAKHEVHSDQSGHFQFAELLAGDYQLEATVKPGQSRTLCTNA